MREVPRGTNASVATEGRLFAGTDTRQRIGHPQLCGQLWDGCVLTKLSGSLSPAQMADDLRFRRERFSPYRQIYFTKDGTAATFCLIVLAALANGCRGRPTAKRYP